MSTPSSAMALSAAEEARFEALAARFGTPLYAYDFDALRQRARQFLGTLGGPQRRPLFATKANTNPSVLRLLMEEGFGFDAVSRGELETVLALGAAPDSVVLNGNNLHPTDFERAEEAGVTIIADGLDQLRSALTSTRRAPLAIRVDTGVAAGHHEKVRTGGPASKFGVTPEELPEVVALLRKAKRPLVGLQQHVGSGALDPAELLSGVAALVEVARQHPPSAWIDFGGGFGIPYRPRERAFDLAAFARGFEELTAPLHAGASGPLELRFEPGRWLVGPVGWLLTRITALKPATPGRWWIGTDSGTQQLLRPALYESAWHGVSPFGPRPAPDSAPPLRGHIVGQVCETGDVLARDRELPPLQIGSGLALHGAGAYGFSMASTYNSVPRPAEVAFEGASARMIRARETLADLWRGTELSEIREKSP